MKNYKFSQLSNSSTPIGGTLNGSYIPFDELTNSAKILISNPKYITLVRETTINSTKGGGRTTGTLWHNKQVIGFTVEDAIRDVKIPNKTAIPDTLEDPSKFNGVPANVYSIVLSPQTSSDFIRKSFYNGSGMRVSSKSDNTGTNILEKDVYAPKTFSIQEGGKAFDGVFIHQGTSENESSGCIIFSRTRNINGTINMDAIGVQLLNKYLQSVKLLGKGKFQQLNIINTWELNDPPPDDKIFGSVIDADTNKVISGVTTQLIPK